jgi:hypothetical protein
MPGRIDTGAEGLRVLAERMHSPEAKSLVLGVVRNYERLAKDLQQQSSKP